MGMILPGVVKKLMTYGVFIEFSTGIFGLAPNSVSIMNVRHRSAHVWLPTDQLVSCCKLGDAGSFILLHSQNGGDKGKKEERKEKKSILIPLKSKFISILHLMI